MIRSRYSLTCVYPLSFFYLSNNKNWKARYWVDILSLKSIKQNKIFFGKGVEQIQNSAMKLNGDAIEREIHVQNRLKTPVSPIDSARVFVTMDQSFCSGLVQDKIESI